MTVLLTPQLLGSLRAWRVGTSRGCRLSAFQSPGARGLGVGGLCSREAVRHPSWPVAVPCPALWVHWTGTWWHGPDSATFPTCSSPPWGHRIPLRSQLRSLRWTRCVSCPARACSPCPNLRREQDPEVFLHNPPVEPQLGLTFPGKCPFKTGN